MELLIGIIGMCFLLIAFLLNQIGKWDVDDLQYDLFNALGSILLLIYAYMLNSIPFIIVNLVWALFSVKDVFLDLRRK